MIHIPPHTLRVVLEQNRTACPIHLSFCHGNDVVKLQRHGGRNARVHTEKQLSAQRDSVRSVTAHAARTVLSLDFYMLNHGVC